MICKHVRFWQFFESNRCIRTWGSTGKEVERSSFWIEGTFHGLTLVHALTDFRPVPRIWRNFKLSFTICFACIAMMVIFTTNLVPYEWQIPGWEWALVIPLALVVGNHILLPVRFFYYHCDKC